MYSPVKIGGGKLLLLPRRWSPAEIQRCDYVDLVKTYIFVNTISLEVHNLRNPNLGYLYAAGQARASRPAL